jgi:hypothetical protein
MPMAWWGAFVALLGLSISQLLGQNTQSRNKEKIDAPGALLEAFLKQPPIDRTERRLISTFSEFIKYYGRSAFRAKQGRSNSPPP